MNDINAPQSNYRTTPSPIGISIKPQLQRARRIHRQSARFARARKSCAEVCVAHTRARTVILPHISRKNCAPTVTAAVPAYRLL
jgi:hypothetical protein